VKTVFSLLLALLLAVTGSEALAQISDINNAINKAGRQRMLSQRMAKVYFQIGLQVVPDRSKKLLDNSVATFDRQLVELKNYAPTPEIKSTYVKLESLWLEYKDLLLGSAPSQENGRKVLSLSEDILATAHQGTVQLEKHSGTTAGRLINISGRQRMLSQRIAKFYQAIAWNVADSQSATANIEKARKEFSEGLAELVAAPSNTAEIKDCLDLVKIQWFFFENALSDKYTNADKRHLLVVATTSERILEELENAVTLYEKLPK